MIPYPSFAALTISEYQISLQHILIFTSFKVKPIPPGPHNGPDNCTDNIDGFMQALGLGVHGTVSKKRQRLKTYLGLRR